MTVETTSNKKVAQGNNATTSWPYGFEIPSTAECFVTLVDNASGEETVLSQLDYVVMGIGSELGGSVSYPLTGPPLTPAFSIVIERLVTYTQKTDLTNQGAVYPEDIESALDYLTFQTQQLSDAQKRSIVFSVADEVEQTLPVASARAGKLLGFASDGAPVAVAGIDPSVQVSAAMIPVVTAPTTDAALAALGLPGGLLNLLIPSGTVWDYDAGNGIDDAPDGFVYPIGQPCTSLYPDYRDKLLALGSPYGNNGTDPLMPDRRSRVSAGKSNMGGVDDGLLPGGTVLGAELGVAAIPLATENLPPYTPSGAIANGAITTAITGSPVVGNSLQGVQGGGSFPSSVVGSGTIGANSTQAASTFNGAAQGGISTPVAIVQPTFVCNKILKVH